MEWFKFYSSRWLSDLRIKKLSTVDRLLFITLMCVTNVTDESDERTGVVYDFDESAIILATGLHHNTDYDNDYAYCEYSEATGFSKRLEKAGLIEFIDESTITIVNYQKRQQSNLSGAERAKKYREKKKLEDTVTKPSHSNVTNVQNRNARVEKSRVEKSRDRIIVQDGISFDEFWNIYPVKKSKKTAEKKWVKLKPDVQEIIISDIPKRFAEDDQWIKGFIPHPTTYLNQERWNDEITSKIDKGHKIYVAE